MSFISALVLQLNNDNYINGGVNPGTLKLVPTPNSGGYVFADYWAVPVADGIVSGWDWVVTSPDSTDAPDPQAVHVVRINSTQSRDDWYVLGTSTQYIQAAKDAECCESPAYDLPTTISDIAPCQALCANSDGYGFGVFGIPSPVGEGEQLTATGFYTVAATGVTTTLPEISAADADALETALNGNGTWAAVGQWTASDDDLTLSVIQDSLLTNTQEPNIACVLIQVTES